MAFLKWLYPGMRVKRWFFLFAAGVAAVSFGLALLFNYRFISVVEENLFTLVYSLTGQYMRAVSALIGSLIVLIGLGIMIYATRLIIRSIVSAVAPEGTDKLADIIFNKRRLNRGASIVVIGGGTGLSTLLRGIKSVTSNITAIVTVADDGGSSGRLRQDFGMVPPGDMRSCLVALADTEPLMEKLFQHRFGGGGDLAGHSFGNLFIAAMTEVLGDVEMALKESSKVLAVRGQVLPSCAKMIGLVAEMEDGQVVQGESNITRSRKKIRRVTIEPADTPAVGSAIEAIKTADAVIIGPGSLYTSVMPNLLVKELADTLRSCKAVKIYVCNVMTQPGETDGYAASDHVQAIVDHVGPGVIDYALVNVQDVASCLLDNYAQEGACPVPADIEKIEALGVQAVRANLISETNWVRHDPVRLARTILAMVYQLKDNPKRLTLFDYYMIERQARKPVNE